MDIFKLYNKKNCLKDNDKYQVFKIKITNSMILSSSFFLILL